MGLQEKERAPQDLFDDLTLKAKSDTRMRVMDEINRKMGSGSISIASIGTRHRWSMRLELKSQDYTSDWNQLIKAW